MEDLHGDGLCCAYGNGSFELRDDQNNVITSASSYEKLYKKHFCLPAVTPTCPTIDFSEYDVMSYTSQDEGNYEVQDGGNTLLIRDNGWKAIEFPFIIANNSYLRFEFRSDREGEIHGIGFDRNNNMDIDQIYTLYGTAANQGISDYNNYSGTGWKEYTIPLGEHYIGGYPYLFFIADDDDAPTGNSYFRNVRLYEDECLVNEDDPVDRFSDGNKPRVQSGNRGGIDEARAYPNPFRNTLQLELPDTFDPAEVALVNIHGEVIKTYHGMVGHNQIGKELNLQPGVYIIRIRTKDVEQYIKVIHIE